MVGLLTVVGSRIRRSEVLCRCAKKDRGGGEARVTVWWMRLAKAVTAAWESPGGTESDKTAQPNSDAVELEVEEILTGELRATAERSALHLKYIWYRN